MLSRWAALALALALTAPSTSSAQAEGDVDRARARYAEGLAAVDEARWGDALEAFEASYTLSGVGAALFNVATTLRALGRHVDARAALERLLAAHPELDPEMRAAADAMLREERARVATLVLAGLPPPPAPRALLDGVEVADDGARPLRLAVDPGPRHVVVTADGRAPFEWRGTLADGAIERVDVRLAPAATGGDDPEILLWILAACGVALAAGAVALGWAVWEADEPRPDGPQVIRL